MLDILRRNAKNVLTYVLFGIIIVVFVVSFGPGSRGCTDARVGAAAWAAKVNGEQISGGDFEQHYANLFRAYQAQAGQAFSRELAEQLGLRRAAMDQVVERELLLQEAERLGLVVTDLELEGAIKRMTVFHTDGRFDGELYSRATSSAYGTRGRFEERLRRDLAVQKVMALLRQVIQVSPAEVREAFESDGDRVSLEYVRFPLAAARAEVRPTADQVREFRSRSAKRIEAFYAESKDRFDRKKRVQARHVLFRADEGAAAEVDAGARRKAEEVLERARKGEDFAGLARALSEDPGSKEKGGDLGWFGAGVMARPFEEAAFAARKGDLVGPVRSRFGWHAIQVLDVQEPELVGLEKAAPEIAQELLQGDLARALAERRAAEALARARAGRSLAELFPPEPDARAARKGPPPVKLGGQVIRPDETGSFGAGARPTVPRLGAAPELFADALAAAGPQLLGRVYETAGGPVVARVKERTRPDPAQFAARRGEVEARLRRGREAQVEQAWVRSLRDKASVTVNEAYVRGDVSLPPVQLDD
jgi:peptidyl-prolyl cis-trans isomerase D